MPPPQAGSTATPLWQGCSGRRHNRRRQWCPPPGVHPDHSGAQSRTESVQGIPPDEPLWTAQAGGIPAASYSRRWSDGTRGVDLTDVHALEVRGLTAGSGALAVVHNVAFHVSRGGDCPPIGAERRRQDDHLDGDRRIPRARDGGEVLVDGITLEGPAYRRGRERIGIVLEGRSIFPSLTVKQNLELAEADLAEALDPVPGVAIETGPPSRAPERRGRANAGLGQGGMSASSGPLDSTSSLSAWRPPSCERIFDRLRIHRRGQLDRSAACGTAHPLRRNRGRSGPIMNGGTHSGRGPRGSELAAREADIEKIYLVRARRGIGSFTQLGPLSDFESSTPGSARSQEPLRQSRPSMLRTELGEQEPVSGKVGALSPGGRMPMAPMR